MKFEELKAKANELTGKAIETVVNTAGNMPDINMDNAKKYGKQALQYAKDNPSDIMVGLITLMVMDMDDSIESIEDATAVSALVDADAYINHRY